MLYAVIGLIVGAAIFFPLGIYYRKTVSEKEISSAEEEGKRIINEAILSGGGITPVTATETVTPNGAPLLSISKSVSPAVVTENGQITYTFIIQNQGNTPAVATDNVIVTDTFNPILSDLAVTVNGVPIAETTGYTYNPTTGEFATIPGIITVDAATYVQDATTGTVIITPGVTVVTVTGTV